MYQRCAVKILSSRQTMSAEVLNYLLQIKCNDTLDHYVYVKVSFVMSGVLVLPLSAVYEVVDTWIFSRESSTSQ
jgi:hypothetical protein